MKKYQVSFFELDSDHFFNQLSKTFESNITDDVIKIPENRGHGVIRKVRLEEGLCIRFWNFRLDGSILFEKTPHVLLSQIRTYHIVFVLNPETLTYKIGDSPKKLKFPTGKNILFVSDDTGISFEIDADYNFKVLDISVTSTWLIDALKGEREDFTVFIAQLNKKPLPINFFEASSASEYRILTELHSTGLSEEKGLLQIKANVFSLVSSFFNKIFSQIPRKISDDRIVVYDKMLQVEKILNSCLESSLPGIDLIARQVSMSASTLKRHFKVMYGKNIYEYYLEIKMDFAKRLLLENDMTVNEIATRLDYEKVNNFISMFKRYHGISPGSLRRKIA